MPCEDDFSDLVCKICTKQYSFLQRYACTRYFVSSDVVETGDSAVALKLLNELESKKYDVPKTSTTNIELVVCTLPTSKQEQEHEHLFFTEDWRSTICKCEECLVLLKDITFLILNEKECEPLPAPNTSIFEEAMKALSQLDHCDQINGIAAFNTMKRKLDVFFKGFVEKDQVVTADDIESFFAVFITG
jgi:E3 ubiquitin-protein ligase UBR7